MKRVQTLNSPFYSLKVPLDGTQYQLTFRWNHRTSTWSLDLDASDGTAIVHGLRLMVGVPLLRRYHYLSSCPPGELLVSSQTADDSPPGLNDLADGGRCLLVYVPYLDLLAYSQGNYAASDNG